MCLLIIVVLVLCNGLLSMSELAVVSSRPARLKVMAAEGNKGAAVALRLAENPSKFLSSAQVGISLILGAVSCSAWAVFGSALRPLLSSRRAVRTFNIVMALLLLASLIPVFMET